ncbi:MAG: hypothetical protein IJR34_03435 [Bacteroidales bacterium]|nr:hypothetical protein [Bacteroidales bacterium]
MPAQTAYDALTLGQNQYGGTARTMAMGNAFTALGGDLGSIAINPAGSAVAGYSQIAVTPGLEISNSLCRSTNYYGGPDATKVSQNKADFRLPNVSFNLNFGLGSSILKNFNVSFSSNLSDSYTEQTLMGGNTNLSSYFGALAQAATFDKINAADLAADTHYERYPFDLVLGYNAYLFSPIKNETNRYVGITENATGPDAQGNYNISMREGGMLKQAWGREVTGAKNDYIVNFGFNFLDKLFIGANIGLTTINRKYSDYFREAAVNPSIYDVTFEKTTGETVNTYWKDGSYNYSLTMNGTGVYGKFGIIYVPTPWLRIGAAIQTPTTLNIVERYGASVSSSFDNAIFSSRLETGTFENKYTLRTPMRANFGIAGVIAKRFILSADYEFCPYGDMVFQHNKINAEDWREVNQSVSSTLGMGHSLRFGLEGRINSALSARLGYSITSNPSLSGVDGKNGLPINHFVNWGKHGENKICFGLGYNSKGSFFADLAAVARIYPTGFFYPYDDIRDKDGSVVVLAPEYVVNRTLWTVAVTIGWRF